MEKNEKKILEQGIAQYAPGVSKYLQCRDTLLDHAKNLYVYTPDETHLRRQKKFTPILQQYIKKVFGKDVHIPTPLTLNIVDHHAPLTHPILVAANIVSNAHTLLEHTSKSPVLVLSSAIVPPNNFLNKKGLHLHGKSIPLFSNKEIHQAAYFMESRDITFIYRLKNSGRWKDFSASEKQFLSILEENIQALPLNNARSYIEQVSLVNAHMWKQLFHASIQEHIPDLLQIPSEQVFADAADNIFQSDTLVYKVLFDAELRSKTLATFEGIGGCWDSRNKKGTHFFWYRSDKNQPIPLQCVGNALVTVDGKVSIPLEEDVIVTHLVNQQIIPSGFLRYTWEIFWLGIRPLAGYGSSTYLTHMKQAWLNVLQSCDVEEAARIAAIDTTKLIAGEVVTYKQEGTYIEEQYALDVMYDGGLTKEYLEQLVHMPFADLVRPAMIDIYKSYVPKEEQQNITLTPQDLMGKTFNWLNV